MVRHLIDISDTEVKVDDKLYDLVDEFRKLKKSKLHGSRAVVWLVLMYDKKSPYRKLPEEDRKEILTKDLYGKTSYYALERPEMKAAIKKYRALDYDPLEEQYAIFTGKMSELNEYIKDFEIKKKDVWELQKVMVMMDKITESREKLRKLIEKREEEGEHMRGGAEKSLIEEVHSNKDN